MMTDAELASILAPSQNQRQPVAALQRGLAVADSADGEVRVRVPGYVLTDVDDVADRGVVTIPTLGGIQAGSVVNILTYGELGSAHQLLALGAIGATDDLVAAVAAAQQTADDAYTIADTASSQVSGLDTRMDTAESSLSSIGTRLGNCQFHRITRWENGTTWSSLASGVISNVLLDAVAITNGYLGILVGHLSWHYKNSSPESAWVSHNLLSLRDFKFPQYQMTGVWGAVRPISPAGAGVYVETSTGTQNLKTVHFDQLVSGEVDIHSNIIFYIHHKDY